MRLLLGTVAALALSAPIAPALAADLPVKARPVPVPVAAYSWTGFYIGANAGYSWGSGRTDLEGSITTTTRTRVFRSAGPTLISDVTTGPTTLTAFASDRASIDGVIGGGQVGYNWQTAAWVWGLETDFQWSGERGG